MSNRRGTSYIRAINRALHEEMERDPGVLVIGLDVGRQGGSFGATRNLHERFGSRPVIGTPISDAGYTGAAIGLAMEGFRPVAEMQFADFVTPVPVGAAARAALPSEARIETALRAATARCT
jgi:pyruvate/2-oxoglutarate/acetoin dehydrogenase E1 component